VNRLFHDRAPLGWDVARLFKENDMPPEPTGELTLRMATYKQMTEKHISSFTATDPNGVPHQVDHFQTFLVFTSTGGKSRRLGTRLFKCNGKALRRLGKGQYEMDSPGGPVLLLSDDPGAI
jgi:hypothetical protein